MLDTYSELPDAVTKTLQALSKRVREALRGVRSMDLSALEREVGSALGEVGRAVVAQALSALDDNGQDVVVDGVRWWQAVRSPQHYMCGFGRVSVERGVYRAVRNGPTLCPMELRAGIIEGFWTPHAAKVAALSVSDMTPQRAEQFFRELGMMAPSKSSLDRLPKALNERWESQRELREAQLRALERVPDGAVSVAVMIDGVMAPMRDSEKAEKKARTRQQGRADKGPAGYREVACGALVFYDADGNRLLTRRMARMPEAHMATLKQQLRAELQHVLAERPDLIVVALADGAANNWRFLETLSADYEVVDFYHAAEHLKRALDVARGASSVTTQRKYHQLREVLRDEASGVNKVTRSLVQLRPKASGTARDYRTGVNYFKRHQARMSYAELQSRNLPIGSGVIEGTCKSLASDRLKRAGMRWCSAGGQAILNLRAWTQSERFDNAWSLLRATYAAQVIDFPAAA